jgi:hypothetical protein
MKKKAEKRRLREEKERRRKEKAKLFLEGKIYVEFDIYETQKICRTIRE